MTRFQLDSGATCNIITANVLKELEIKELQKTNQILNMYNNTKSFFDRYRYLPRRVNYRGSILIQL
jgi:hypothetical protein